MTALPSDTVAIITGAGRGIGRAIAERLAQAGAAVALAARTSGEIEGAAATIRAVGGCAEPVSVDVTDWDAVRAMVEMVERRLGPVDLLVNNAGIGGAGGYFWDVDPARWWRTVEVNLRGAMLCARAVLPNMIARGRGRVINVASNTAIRINAYGSDYAGSKAALLRFTDSIAEEARPFGVSVFTISPGLVRTRLSKRDARAGDPDTGATAAPRMRTFGPWVPPERAADLVVQLASGRADALAGRFIHVSDDIDELVGATERIRAEGLYVLRLPKLSGLAE